MRVNNWWWSKYVVAPTHTYFCDVNARFPGIMPRDRRYANRVCVTNHSGGRKRGCFRGGTEAPYTTLVPPQKVFFDPKDPWL